MSYTLRSIFNGLLIRNSRDSSSEALTAMAENISVYRAIHAVSDGGLHHKSNVVRGEVARIFDIIVTQLGAERIVGSSKEFQEIVFGDGALLLTGKI